VNHVQKRVYNIKKKKNKERKKEEEVNYIWCLLVLKLDKVILGILVASLFLAVH
jgi:hypothetical protein